MSFWGNAANQGTSFEVGGGFEPIPNNTWVVAALESARLYQYDPRPGEQESPPVVSLTWRIAQPEAYANRVIFQNVRIWDNDPAKAERAKRMLVAIDANTSGGRLVQTGQPPTDESLTVLLQRPVKLRLSLWNRKDGDPMNIVVEVAPATHQTQQAPPTQAVQPPPVYQQQPPAQAPAQPRAQQYQQPPPAYQQQPPPAYQQQAPSQPPAQQHQLPIDDSDIPF